MIRARANHYNFAVAFFVALGSLTYGFNSAIIGSVIGLPSFYAYFGFQATTSYGGSIIGATNGLYAAGGFIGCWVVNWFLDRLGRKLSIQLISVLCIISAAIQTGSVHIAMLLIGRFLNGFAVGLIDCTIPTYISEISPPRQRGRMVCAHGIGLCVGYALAGWAGVGTYFEPNPAIQWRLCVALQIVAPLLLLIGSPLVPESPRWLINKGRDDQGLEVLVNLHQHPTDPDNLGAREEFLQIQKQVALERQRPTGNIFRLLLNPVYRKRFLYAFFLQALCQSSGVLVINNYMVIELGNLGVTGWRPLLLNGTYNSWAAIGNWVNSLLVDRFGRIRVIATGLTGGMVAVILTTAMIANYGGVENTNKVGAGFGIAFMFVFGTFYGSCVDATSYVYCSEIFPTQVRAQGIGFSTSALFLFTIVYTTAAGPAFNSIGWRFYLIFIILPAIMIPVVIKFFPETKNLSLEEIGALFGDEVALDITHLSEKERQELEERISRPLASPQIEESEGFKNTQEQIEAVEV
ncbi:hypothetical protein LTR47_009900 [Exophiala xenobiotica]|nr:hypothetical protein LTR47_009900 [Exophiala xenobiotica]KAK5243925.1 hypothetical protein LTS06_010401 [Exophiala xenobiotica]KAK5282191.1 hypothetical protein LTR40_003673 [Exophiala xenobiotica]KAK5347944.1 hypothetical protein LTR61_008196 [Exophiala xenobiotica]KAK5361447.1 hypothetical protein LTS03_010400 [Exophiala xenobiotica]